MTKAQLQKQIADLRRALDSNGEQRKTMREELAGLEALQKMAENGQVELPLK